jgi:hypothetical protein
MSSSGVEASDPPVSAPTARAQASPSATSPKETSALESPSRFARSPRGRLSTKRCPGPSVRARTAVTMSGPRRDPSPFSSIPTRRVETRASRSTFPALVTTRILPCCRHPVHGGAQPRLPRPERGRQSRSRRFLPRRPLTKRRPGNRFARFQKQGQRASASVKDNGDEQGSAQEVQNAAHRKT